MSSRKLLILDLDETLIHASVEPFDREADFVAFEYHVYKRPHLDVFLDYAFGAFDVGVWTSSGKDYAEVVVSQIFGAKQPLFLSSSLKCTPRRDFNTGGYVPLKRLSKLKSFGYKLEQMIAVDDTPDKLRENYGNLVRATEFNGSEADDELLLLRDYLAHLDQAPNIRSVEKRGWRGRVMDARRGLESTRSALNGL